MTTGSDSLMEIVHMKEGNHLKNLEVNRRIILKLIIRKIIVGFGMDASVLTQCQMVESYKRDLEIPRSKTGNLCSG